MEISESVRVRCLDGARDWSEKRIVMRDIVKESCYANAVVSIGIMLIPF